MYVAIQYLMVRSRTSIGHIHEEIYSRSKTVSSFFSMYHYHQNLDIQAAKQLLASCSFNCIDKNGIIQAY